MPCYGPDENPTNAQREADSIACAIISKQMGLYEIRDYVFKIVTQLDEIKADRDRMGNILCEMGKCYDKGICFPKEFFDWWEEHQKRDELTRKLK